MKKFLIFVAIFPFFVNMALAQEEFIEQDDVIPLADQTAPERYTYQAEITKVENQPCGESFLDETDLKPCIYVEYQLLEGNNQGKINSSLLNPNTDVLAEKWGLSVGDKIIVTEFNFGEFSDYQITEIYRTNSIVWFVLIYFILVLLVGGWQGLGSVLGLAVSILVILKVIIPMTLAGWDPVWVSILGGLCVLLPSIYFSHGFNAKTTIALLGTMLGLFVTGLLAAIALNSISLTGLGGEESLFLVSDSAGVLNMRSILLASMIIGGIGLIDDVTVSQIAVIREIYEENKNISVRRLYKKAMNVGKDHIASMVNTLFLAYTAASLPLIMLLVDQGADLSYIVNIEAFAEEIARTLVASSGLIITVPITTFIGAYLYVHKQVLIAKYKDITV